MAPNSITLSAEPVSGSAALASPGSADDSHLAAASAPAEEPIAAIGLESRHAHAGRHLEPLQLLACFRIDAPQIALVAFPGAVPELAVDPGHSGDEALGFDGAEDRAGLGIELVDLPVAMLPHPERAFGPGEPGAAAVGCRDRGEHLAGRGIDLLDAIARDLEQVPAIEGGACVRSDIDRALCLAARRIESFERVAGGDPDVPAVIGDPVHAFDIREGAILADDFGG